MQTPVAANRGMNAIVKVVSGCNLNCSYCYAGNQEPHSVNRMSFDVLQRLTEQFLSLPVGGIRFNWHGGEPLLAGKTFYNKAIEYQQQYGPPGLLVLNAIQTNATLLDEDWLTFLRERNIDFGVSVDGPNHVNDVHRHYADGRGSLRRVTSVFELMKRRQEAVMGLAVVTPESAACPDEVYDFFISQGVLDFDFLPCVLWDSGAKCAQPPSVDPIAYARFMTRIFDRWIDEDNDAVRIRFLENIVDGLQGGAPTLCRLNGGCGNMLTVDWDGTVYPCDSFMLSEFRLGNIMVDGLQDILVGAGFQRYLTGSQTIPDACGSCRWFSICHGGCAYYRYISEGQFTTNNYFCTANRSMFSHIEQRLRELEGQELEG